MTAKRKPNTALDVAHRGYIIRPEQRNGCHQWSARVFWAGGGRGTIRLDGGVDRLAIERAGIAYVDALVDGLAVVDRNKKAGWM